LELATRAQAREEVLQLLRFPPESWFRQGNWRATAWKNGRYFSKRAKTREAILRHIGPTLNELRLWFLSENSDLETLRIESAVFWLSPAPTSQIWSPVEISDDLGPKKRREARTFRNKRSLIGNPEYLRPYPSVLECSELLIEIFPTTNEYLDEVAGRLVAELLRGELSSQELVGYGCVGGQCRRMMMLDALGGVPAAVDQLGDKFEELYPILIGPRDTCEGLVASLNGIAKLHRVSEESRSAVVTIPPEAINGSTRDLADNWIIDLPALAEEYREEILRKRSKS
jgi:hypothetical protein